MTIRLLVVLTGRVFNDWKPANSSVPRLRESDKNVILGIVKENTRKRKLPLRPWDFVIIGIALVLTGYSAFVIYIKPRNTAQVLIQGPAQQWIYPLDAEETIAVQGPLGNTVVRIHNGEAWVESSPCDNQTCVATGHLNGTGLWAACLPNNVFLVIEGYDAIRELTDSGAW